MESINEDNDDRLTDINYRTAMLIKEMKTSLMEDKKHAIQPRLNVMKYNFWQDNHLW